MNKAKILWLDLEMTGLSPEEDKILEVAAIATDWNFNEVSTFEAPIKVSEDFLKNRMVGEFWETFSETRDTLQTQSLAAEKDSFQVEQDLIAWAKEVFAEEIENGERILLAGNSIHQDRRFIRVHWKEFDALLHYRMLDVSAWKVVMSGKFGRVWASSDSHRALDDIRGSINELKFYLKKVKS